jgi:hypothetical protein
MCLLVKPKRKGENMLKYSKILIKVILLLSILTLSGGILMKKNVYIIVYFLLLLFLTCGCKSNPTEPVSDKSYKIIFDLKDSSGYRDIYIMNVDGSNKIKLTNIAQGWYGYPVLSPDKNKIAFTSYSNGNVEIFTMNIDGSDIKQLTNFLNRTRAAMFIYGHPMV